MDRMNDRLASDVRRALSAGALGADPDLVDMGDVYGGIARRQRRRMAAVSAAGVLVLAGAVGIALAVRGTPSSSDRLGVASQPPAVVTTPPVTEATAEPVSECASSVITFVGATTEGAAGHSYTDLTVKNTGSVPCGLADSPGISFSGNGGPDAVKHTHGLIDQNGHMPAVLPAGGEAHVTLDAQMGCPKPATTYKDIELVLSDGRPIATHETLQSTCALLVSNWFTR